MSSFSLGHCKMINLLWISPFQLHRFHFAILQPQHFALIFRSTCFVLSVKERVQVKVKKVVKPITKKTVITYEPTINSSY